MAITRPPKNVGRPNQNPSGRKMVRNTKIIPLMIVMAQAPLLLFFAVVFIRRAKVDIIYE